MNLTGISDAHYRFILVDVGAEGRRSDAGVFANSKIKSGLDSNTLNVPPPSVVDQSELPFVLVADEAYLLSSYLMRPYPKSSQLDLKKKYLIIVSAGSDELSKVLLAYLQQGGEFYEDQSIPTC